VWETGNTYFKPYAACRYTHTAIKSLQELMAGHALRADDIVSIDVHTHRSASQLRDITPASLDHAQYSFPFVLACMLCTGRAGPAEISAATLGDATRLAQAAKVRVRHDPALDMHYPAHYATRIEVRTRAGTMLERTRLVAPGDPDDPMSADELAAKFVMLASDTLGDAEVRRWAEVLVDPAPRPVREILGVLSSTASGGTTSLA
jgi:2-methylcitrate dehydratase PrpD